MTKRQAYTYEDLVPSREAKRQCSGHEDQFRNGLFNQAILEDYKKSYASSEP